MRLIDADALKERHREDLIKNLIDKKRNIDLSKYVKESCDLYNKYIDEMPTVFDIDVIRAEIEQKRDAVPAESGDGAQGVACGLNYALDIIDKHMKGDTNGSN